MRIGPDGGCEGGDRTRHPASGAGAGYPSATFPDTGRGARQGRPAPWVRGDCGDDLPDGLVVADETGRVSVFNRAAARLTGVAPAEAIGADIRQILPLRD